MSKEPRHRRFSTLTTSLTLCLCLLLFACCNGNSAAQEKETREKEAQAGTQQEPTAPNRAIPAFDEPMLSPEVEAMVRRTEMAYRGGVYSTALDVVNEINKEAPDFDYGYVLRGRILTAINRYDEARKAFEKVQEINPDYPGIRFTLGNNAAQRGAYAEALAYYKAEQAAVQAEDPVVKKRAILLQMGKAYQQLGEFDEALAAFRQVVEIDADDPEVYDALGAVYQDQGALEKALDAKKHALQLQPENPDYAYYVGALLFQLGRAQEAIGYLERAKEKMPWFYGVYYNLGRSLMAVGRSGEGERYLAKADSIQVRDGQLGLARSTAEVQNTPDKWTAYADMLYQDARYEEALQAYLVAYSLDPRNADLKQTIDQTRRLLAGK